MIIEATEDFSRWAMGYSGCDGGNLGGSIWFCGIEYGGNEAEDKFQFADVSVPLDISDAERRKFFVYQYNIKIAKLYSAIIGAEVSTYLQTALRDRLFAKESCCFKMNLYPISFHHDSDDLWQKWLYRKTGLPTKSIYRAWCQIHRFPKIRKWITQYSPKLIVATGITYKNEFIMAFDDVETIYRNKAKPEPLSGREFVSLEINEDKTILAIIPFLGGRYGLNSDIHLQEFGKRIQDLCKQKFGEQWQIPI